MGRALKYAKDSFSSESIPFDRIERVMVTQNSILMNEPIPHPWVMFMHKRATPVGVFISDVSPIPNIAFLAFSGCQVNSELRKIKSGEWQHKILVDGWTGICCSASIASYIRCLQYLIIQQL